MWCNLGFRLVKRDSPFRAFGDSRFEVSSDSLLYSSNIYCLPGKAGGDLPCRLERTSSDMCDSQLKLFIYQFVIQGSVSGYHLVSSKELLKTCLGALPHFRSFCIVIP